MDEVRAAVDEAGYLLAGAMAEATTTMASPERPGAGDRVPTRLAVFIAGLVLALVAGFGRAAWSARHRLRPVPHPATSPGAGHHARAGGRAA